MSTPEEIPEDRIEQFPCDCGGNIQLNQETEYYECDSCDFKKGKNNEDNSQVDL